MKDARKEAFKTRLTGMQSDMPSNRDSQRSFNKPVSEQFHSRLF